MQQVVEEVYIFHIQAGKGLSTARSLAYEAHNIAREFFGQAPFELRVEIVGRKDQWTIQAMATGQIPVEDSWT